jgi:hypothetical protein
MIYGASIKIYLFTILHDVTFQNRVVFAFLTMKNTKLTIKRPVHTYRAQNVSSSWTLEIKSQMSAKTNEKFPVIYT